jgi:hypothetical protein
MCLAELIPLGNYLVNLLAYDIELQLGLIWE